MPSELKQVMNEISAAYQEIRQRKDFQEELAYLLADYVGRPSPIFYARRLSEKLGGARIYLKREDLNHTGAHKINHCLGEALLAKFMGKTKVIAETGAGQHGVALATACALVGIPCEIHMGTVDIVKEHPNVTKMKILGATLIPVTRGIATLKDAVDSAFEEYLKDPQNTIYAIGSVVGPQHSYLKDLGRVDYACANDDECPDAFMTLSRGEGIIPALESAHAGTWAIREAPKLSPEQSILINLSGRGDKDADYVADKLDL